MKRRLAKGILSRFLGVDNKAKVDFKFVPLPIGLS